MLPTQLQGSLRYDTEYPAIGYSDAASHNAVARLQARLASGEVKLEFNPVRGYVDSLLKNLNIDATSQVLVYSKSSLQIDWIRGRDTPRHLLQRGVFSRVGEGRAAGGNHGHGQ